MPYVFTVEEIFAALSAEERDFFSAEFELSENSSKVLTSIGDIAAVLGAKTAFSVANAIIQNKRELIALAMPCLKRAHEYAGYESMPNYVNSLESWVKGHRVDINQIISDAWVIFKSPQTNTRPIHVRDAADAVWRCAKIAARHANAESIFWAGWCAAQAAIDYSNEDTMTCPNKAAEYAKQREDIMHIAGLILAKPAQK